jgi:hypothetical protein
MTVAVAARAYMNQGRWIADCPFCGGAERLWDGTVQRRKPAPFPFGLAGGLLHCGYTGSSCPVEFPGDKDTIESILGRRPDELTRNWLLDETVEDLLFENLEHGVG